MAFNKFYSYYLFLITPLSSSILLCCEVLTYFTTLSVFLIMICDPESIITKVSDYFSFCSIISNKLISREVWIICFILLGIKYILTMVFCVYYFYYPSEKLQKETDMENTTNEMRFNLINPRVYTHWTKYGFILITINSNFMFLLKDSFI